MSGFDCRACGACCLGDPSGDRVADIYTDQDHYRIQRLPKATQKRVLVGFFGGGDLHLGTGMKQDRQGNWVCAALRGSVGGGPRRSQCSCSIYGARPYVCRVFRPGSPMCREARKEAGIAS